jgi:hypothetical protein
MIVKKFKSEGTKHRGDISRDRSTEERRKKESWKMRQKRKGEKKNRQCETIVVLLSSLVA